MLEKNLPRSFGAFTVIMFFENVAGSWALSIQPFLNTVISQP